MPHERKFRIRVASHEDVETIESITRAAYLKWVSRIGREPLPMKTDYSNAVFEHRFDLLELNGRAIGLIETIKEGHHLLIENIAVVPDQQRKGVGRLLLKHAEEIAEESGLTELRLYTNELFEGNVTLYKSAGYNIINRMPIDGGIKVDMIKTI